MNTYFFDKETNWFKKPKIAILNYEQTLEITKLLEKFGILYNVSIYNLRWDFPIYDYLIILELNSMKVDITPTIVIDMVKVLKSGQYQLFSYKTFIKLINWKLKGGQLNLLEEIK